MDMFSRSLLSCPLRNVYKVCRCKVGGAIFVIYVFLATGTCQDFAGCRESYFLYSGNCLPCPDHCVTCISNINCTKCTDNYYGVTCQHACLEQDCECHKKYGYCTYGCPDGRYPEEGSANCPICPDSCKLCSSSSDCIVCKPGFHGNTCEKTCPNQCESCNKTTGKCLICGEEYYNEDGKCLRCPERCVGCYNSDNCSSCRAGFLELNAGQCIKLCERTESDSFPDVNKQSDTFTDGGPAFGCKKNLIDQDVVITTRQPCIKYTSCPSNVPCLNCGAMMTHQCTHTCRLENEQSCSGKPDCNVVDGTMYSLAFCLTTKGALSVNNITKKVECVSGKSVLGQKDDVTNVPLDLIGGWVVFVILVVVVPVMAIIILKRTNIIKCFRKWQLAQTNTSDPVEDCRGTGAENVQPPLNLIDDPQRESDTLIPVQQLSQELLKVDKEMQIASSDEVGDNAKNEGETTSLNVGRGNIPKTRSQVVIRHPIVPVKAYLSAQVITSKSRMSGSNPRPNPRPAKPFY